MSDIGVSYDISHAPNPFKVSISVYLSQNILGIKMGSVPPILVTATPKYSGNVLSSALSVIATPMANAITSFLGLFAGELINGKTFPIYPIPPIPYTIGSHSFLLTPKNLSLNNAGTLLKLSGDFTVSQR